MPQAQGGSVWALARRQHGVVTRAQLLELGLSPGAIRHRMQTGRLHLVLQGVYAVGRPQIDRRGQWMAAVLACGPHALLAGRSAAELWGLGSFPAGAIEVVVPAAVSRRRPGIKVHRRTHLDPSNRHERERIPITDIVSTLIDLAVELCDERLEAAINAADRGNLIDPERLRERLELLPPRPGRGRLRTLLDRQTFRPTDSHLERRFLVLLRDTGLPAPETQAYVNGFRVDFYWPKLGLVVETDGLTYHRTASQQARDLHRDQTHSAAGLETLRFSAAQVLHQPAQVLAVLQPVLRRLSGD